MKLKFSYLFASVFYVGKLPLAPGTWGSVIALLVWYLIISYISSITLIVLILVIFGFGVYTSSSVENSINESDPSFIVVDEWIGQWIALLFLEQSVIWGAIAFGLFRLFDIWKPYPIRKLDELHGGWGIMLDDVLAGIYALVLVSIIRSWIL